MRLTSRERELLEMRRKYIAQRRKMMKRFARLIRQMKAEYAMFARMK